ncbi:MazG nucleotide pyrophosphohydrolase domain-containing protein [uncultured Arthrobacter sp.]|uniref:MazG nucleotide pyrophosphohydrolase domain-containing protein n=1 Tax=uncultured Arthrobacter sp. TaxID=114050 RepID=UPI0026110348|nr:MazG nucleotide pyrophosphohydrolase domain-containing protein [uncultured Arthrobacter sp.]
MTGSGDARADRTQGARAGAAVERLTEVIWLLREHCPWTAALDHAALLEYLVEETYELYEAADDVERSRDGTGPRGHLLDELRGELGDVLFQVVLHAQLQAEQGTFGLPEVVETLTAKLVRRNPHVFSPDGRLREAFPASVEQIVTTWQDVKQQERPQRTSPFDGIPHQLPALALAAKTLRRAGEATGPGSSGTAGTAEETVGSELLAVIRGAVAAGVDPERALRRAVLDYQRDHERSGAPADRAEAADPADPRKPADPLNPREPADPDAAARSAATRTGVN